MLDYLNKWICYIPRPIYYMVSMFSLYMFLNISIHYICDWMNCNHWINLLGHNLICNQCLDIKKIIRDNQMIFYGSIISTYILQLPTYLRKSEEI
jgi:hypothetical protein